MDTSELRWRPGPFEVDVFGTRVRFEYATLKLTDLEPQLDAFLQSDDPLRVLIAVDRIVRRTRRDPEVRCTEKTRLARTLLRNPRLDRDDVGILLRLLTWLMTLPQNLEHRFIDEVRRTEGSMSDDYGFLKTPLPWETLAREEGIKLGMEMGVQTGRVEELRTLILRAACSRFALDETTEQSLQAMLAANSDEQVLESAFDAAVLSANRADFDARVRALFGDRDVEPR